MKQILRLYWHVLCRWPEWPKYGWVNFWYWYWELRLLLVVFTKLPIVYKTIMVYPKTDADYARMLMTRVRFIAATRYPSRTDWSALFLDEWVDLTASAIERHQPGST